MEEETRVIALIDMDCFECQIYQRKDPKTKGKPCVLAQKSGRIVSVNYEARPYKINRSQTVPEAKKLCKSLIVLRIPERFDKPDNRSLREASEEVLNVIKEDYAVVEHSPSDEFYLDLTNQVDSLMKTWYWYYCLKHFLSTNWIVWISFIGLILTMPNMYGAILWTMFIITYFCNWMKFLEKIAIELRIGEKLMKNLCKKIHSKTKMTASAGISTNKFRAKIASSKKKPNGTFFVTPSDFDSFFNAMPIAEVPGLKGETGSKIIEQFGINTIGQLKKLVTPQSFNFLQNTERTKIFRILQGKDSSLVIHKEYSKAVRCGKKLCGFKEKQNFTFMEKLFQFFMWILTWITGKANLTKHRMNSKLSVAEKRKVRQTIHYRCLEMSERLKQEKDKHKRIGEQLKLEIVYSSDNSEDTSKTFHKQFPIESFSPEYITKTVLQIFDEQFEQSVKTKLAKIHNVRLSCNSNGWKTIISEDNISDWIKESQEQNFFSMDWKTKMFKLFEKISSGFFYIFVWISNLYSWSRDIYSWTSYLFSLVLYIYSSTSCFCSWMLYIFSEVYYLGSCFGSCLCYTLPLFYNKLCLLVNYFLRNYRGNFNNDRRNVNNGRRNQRWYNIFRFKKKSNRSNEDYTIEEIFAVLIFFIAFIFPKMY